MTEQAIFDSSWINRTVEFDATDSFPSKRWKIVRKLGEARIQEKESVGCTYVTGLAMFSCINPKDLSESEIMKIYIQMPNPNTESSPTADRAKQALSKVEIIEQMALLTLTKGGCTSAPLLKNWKWEEQSESGPIPGGYMVYLVVENVPGVRLSRSDYWNFSRVWRDEIREAFKAAYMDCLSHGIVHTAVQLGINLIWDASKKRIYIVNFRLSRLATENEGWRSSLWLTSGFAERRPVSDTQQRLLPDILENGSINEEIWII